MSKAARQQGRNKARRRRSKAVTQQASRRGRVMRAARRDERADASCWMLSPICAWHAPTATAQAHCPVTIQRHSHSSVTAETNYEEPVQRGDCRFMAHLGHGVEEGAPVVVPTLVAMPVLISQVAAGALHSLALDEHGCVWIWGWGGNGRLG